MSKKPAKFTLERLKRASGGGLEVEWMSEEREGSEIYQDSNAKESPKVQHADLDRVLDRMKAHVSRVIGLSWIDTIRKSTELSEKEKGAFNQLSKILDSGFKSQEDRIIINGVSISGQDKRRAVVIMATIMTDNKRKVAFNTPLILLSSETFGFESLLNDDIEELTEEAAAYVFDGKKAQLELFNDNNSVSEEAIIQSIDLAKIPKSNSKIAKAGLVN